MNGAEAYLDSEYHTDKQEFQDISELVTRDLVPVFSDFVATDGRARARVGKLAGTRWPYEIWLFVKSCG